jgi:hypothetical protein
MDTPPTDRAPHSGWYLIRIKGRLPSRWVTHFDGMTLSTAEDGTTLIQGPVVDQAALHGLLQQVRDTGLPLVSVDQAASEDPHQADPDAPTTHPR